MLHDTHVYAYLWITLSKLRGHEFIQPSFLNSKEDYKSADDEEIEVFCRRLFSVVFVFSVSGADSLQHAQGQPKRKPEIPVVFENPNATREKRRGSNVFTG